MRTQARLPGPRGPVEITKAVRGLTSEPAPTLDALVAKYGSSFLVPAGPMTMAVVGDPAHLNALLTTSTDAFRWGHPFNVLKFIVGPGSMIVSDGTEHRRRRGATQRGFARRRLDGLQPIILEEADRFIDELPETGDLYEHGRTLVRRIVVRALFGDALGDRADELGVVLEPAMTYGVQPAVRQLPHPLPFGRRAAARAALNAGDAIIYEEIDRRRRAPRPEEPADILDMLIAAEGDEVLARSEIRDQVITLIAAGYDTTASALAWTLLAAARDAEIWNRLRGDTAYAEAVVRESLRLYPPGLFSPRQAMRDIEVGGSTIKKRTMILWSPYVAGRSYLWGDPLTFRPERFIDPDNQPAIDSAWMPFGKGPRACIGFALAMMELTLVLARIAERVDIHLDATEIPKPEGMIVNRPSGGVPARVIRRPPDRVAS
jgi:cytochrome P450